LRVALTDGVRSIDPDPLWQKGAGQQRERYL
jgi:hypothetical protein